MTSKPRNVLFVVYDFPPSGSRGAKRTLKFIKHLPSFGWNPVVLTVTEGNQTTIDDSLMKEVPAGIEIHRARSMEKGALQFAGRTTSKALDKSRSVGPRPSGGQHGLGRLRSWGYHAIGDAIGIPDSRVLWVPWAWPLGKSLLRSGAFSAIYCSGPSHTNHVLGGMLGRRFGLPLVLDFRDAWVGNPVTRGQGRWRAAWHTRLERNAVRTAARVVSTTEGITADFVVRYPGSESKFVTIPNGYDSDDFTLPPRSTDPALASLDRQPGGPLQILHAGTLGGERSPKSLLVGLSSAVRRHPDLKRDLQIEFLGESRPFQDGKSISDYIDELDLGAMVHTSGYVSRLESIQRIAAAPLLLAIIGDVPADKASSYGISAKLYDYAAARKPVLTIASPGPSASMARLLRLGPVVSPDRPDEIADTLLTLADLHRRGTLTPTVDQEVLARFEFRELTRQLADCFDVASRTGAGSA